ncbi:Monensin polyketide synthase putative ketoacyl reductase [Lachnellula cervina]|uniref:Monensin polyketide synthase putative ketoacyl reductase n=1 Tax=Lachnellula cervina TaxID=1316786 RepID=A0A7D8YRM2_9HELO|nr:Monensin polyketide synthase putative ketoacyl reductase [Lachnellula cervina]
MAATLLKGTAYITGGASGIGRATAFGLARHGIKRLALTDISQKNLSATSEALKSQYPDVEIESMQIDVRDVKAVDDSMVQVVKRFGRIDVAVNVAGVSGAGKTTDASEESEWMGVLDVNLNGVWRSQRTQVRAMMKQENLGIREGRGSIINVASMYGLIAAPAYIPATPYTSSKHGVIGLTRSDAITYAPHGIRINAICPGYVRTPLLHAATEAGSMDPEIAKTPMGRLAEVEEVADAIAFMASPMASFMAGSALLVDGGYSAN